MREIKLDNEHTTLVDDEDYDFLMQWEWKAVKGRNTFYARRLEGRDRKVVFIHRVVTNASDGILVDHRDRNGLNNQKYNLRKATRSQNLQNQETHSNNILGYKGVSIHRNGMYRARITINGKLTHIGLYDTIEDAAQAYDEWAILHFGEFAKLNFHKEIFK